MIKLWIVVNYKVINIHKIRLLLFLLEFNSPAEGYYPFVKDYSEIKSKNIFYVSNKFENKHHQLRSHHLHPWSVSAPNTGCAAVKGGQLKNIKAIRYKKRVFFYATPEGAFVFMYLIS